MSLTCKDCGKAKTPDAFHADASRPGGRHPYCKACRIIREEARRRAKGIKAHPIRTEEEIKTRRDNARRARYALDPERGRLQSAKARKKNPSYGIEYMRQWRLDNPEAAHALSARASTKRKEAIRLATPKWATPQSLRDFYKATPVGMEVDHIIPIQGFTAEGYPVWGLHCVANFQYLATADNRRKGNKMRPMDMILVESGE